MSGLSLESVSLAYGGQTVLERIDLDIPEGQLVSILGASGSGKSSLLRLVAGLQVPDGGSLRWRGAALEGPSPERGIVFQDYALFPWLNMRDNVSLAITQARPSTPRREARREAEEHLARVGLAATVERYPFELSGGMQQRGAIARAFALGSPLLLLDEPFGALDPVNRARLQDLLAEVWRQARPVKTVLFVTHDVDEALYLGDRVIILGSSPGRVIADLDVSFARPRERQALLNDEAFQALRRRINDALAADILRGLQRVESGEGVR
ncbi:ABC transporter ATP-binding protein [Zestomonas carbonaria]|uniref:Nitrate import ATP-binding protein NrtD n=1 Tax=Zestomonas carbonaria TaxID=2762745 RepID=A0A7U7EQV3_9GAMM|nr:ABC transporter ATP-binding protein [Pseudomonas carbonaria]CAD5109517.1 Nitrate import ATP-binding protein NrtD [Pseudomonas carbonaria]